MLRVVPDGDGVSECRSHASQYVLNVHCERVRATEHAARGPFYLLERRHGLAEMVERGTGVVVERLSVSPPHTEREVVRIPENASRHGYRSAQQ